MKKNTIILLCAISLFMGFNACKSKNSASEENPISIATLHSAQNSLDWAGSYMGVVPCADCPGIETRITLNKDGTYTMIRRYIDKDANAFETKGTFQWNEAGNAVILTDLRDKIITNYAVGENKLTQLDADGKVLSGNLANNYILAKADPLLVGKRWRLVELNGKPVEKKDAYMILDLNTNKVSGNLGCNTFTGAYNLRIGNRIQFSQVVATLKMCLDMEVEDGLKNVLNSADNYNVSEKKLTLNRARMAPLARFELVK